MYGSSCSEEESKEDTEEKNDTQCETSKEESKQSETAQAEEVPPIEDVANQNIQESEEKQKETAESKKDEVVPLEEPPKLEDPSKSTCPGNSASSPAESTEVSAMEDPAKGASGDWVRWALISSTVIVVQRNKLFDLWWPTAFVDKFKCLRVFSWVSSVKHTCNTCTWSQIMYILAHSRFVFQKASLTFNNYLKKKNDNCKRVSAKHKRIDVYKRQYQFSKVSNGECSRSGNPVHDVILFWLWSFTSKKNCPTNVGLQVSGI